MSSDYEAINSELPYLTQVTLGCCLDVPTLITVLLPTHHLDVSAPVLSGIKPNIVVSLPVEG